MSHVRIWAKIKLDSTGNEVRIPVICLLKDGELITLEPLVRYLVNHMHVRSHAWMNKLCEIVGKLLDYIETHRGVQDKPVRVFEGFVNALYNGTFNSDGEDPSGLCWMPSNSKTVDPKLYMLEEMSDWMLRERYISECLNPWTQATSTERRFNWLAWYRSNQYSFLGHLAPSAGASAALHQARVVKIRRKPTKNIRAPKAFPQNSEVPLLTYGFIQPGKENSKNPLEKFDWRGICITMLLLYGARRVSEPFHLWVGDVMEHPDRPGNALVRIYHPELGQAPDAPRINGRRAVNRQAYLQAFFPKYPPRTKGIGNYHAGFKSRSFTDDTVKYLHVFWLPTEYGDAFLYAYSMYMRQRVKLGIDSKKHPFAFVSHKGKYKGEPYTISSFEKKWMRAMRRIGLPHLKLNGTTTHGLRHAYGMRANKGGVGVLEAQEAFGHSSPESQLTYRAPGVAEITKKLDTASMSLQYEQDLQGGAPGLGKVDLRTIWEVQDKAESRRYKLIVRRGTTIEK